MQDEANRSPGEDANSGATSLQHEVERLRAALAEREASLRRLRERCEHDLLQARRELARSREEQERLAEQLYAGRPGSTDQASAVPAAQGRKNRRRRWRPWRARAERPMEREVALLYQSNLFDAEWYLSQYPDVANTGIDPAEHYLLHGASEGRNPGPDFNTHQYVFEHPELVDSGENPVLHHVRMNGAMRRR